MQILRGKLARPRKVLLYGTHGIGKTTWASASPQPIVVQTEEGCDDIGVDRFPVSHSCGDVANGFAHLLSTSHDYKTVIIDSLDWLERLIFADVARKHGVKSIEELKYGKGYVFAVQGFEWVLSQLEMLRAEKGLTVVLLAHTKLARVEPPNADTYMRNEPDLHKLICPLLMEWADEVLYAAYQMEQVKVDEGFGRKRTKVLGDSERVIYTREQPGFLAKRRIDLPDAMELSWADYQAAWPVSKGGV